MIEELPESGERVLAVRLSGTISLEDYQTWLPELTRRLAEARQVRGFLDWEALEGWSPEAGSDRFLFRKAYGDHVERIAIVGDERWEPERERLALFITGEVRLFSPSEREAAWQWLREGLN